MKHPTILILCLIWYKRTLDIFKDKSLDSQEAKAIEDYKPATHVDLKQLRNEIDGLRSQKRSLNEIRNTLEEKYDYQREETKQIIDAWRGSRPRIPTIKNPSEGKKAGKDFEDRVWRLFYNMGADYLNSHIKDFQFDLSEYEDLLPSKAQIDVLGIFKGRFIL